MNPVNPNPSSDPYNDLALQNYQDDLDTDNNIRDPLMDELSDDPTKELGVNPNEFRDELNHYDTEGDIDDDRREEIEDRDQDRL